LARPLRQLRTDVSTALFQLFAQTTANFRPRDGTASAHDDIDMLNPFSLVGVLAPIKGDKRATWFTNPETFTRKILQRFQRFADRRHAHRVGTVGPNAYDEVTSFLGHWNGLIAHHTDKFLRVDDAQASMPREKPARSASSSACKIRNIFARWTMSIVSINSDNASPCLRTTAEPDRNGSTERHDEGVSDFGVTIIERMNKMGMAVDTAHCRRQDDAGCV